MIVEDERDGLYNFEYDTEPHAIVTAVDLTRPTSTVSFEDFLENYEAIRNSEKHFQLRNDLIRHLWQFIAIYE
ncbi:hypothetical protein Pst134EB_001669 [Puccinia striiformis f. sp. tritici]|nr:hypothetical protein Pst134EB_001669 [Puccinia striiformis f. sp. tritici]